ncbi:hypothetical protein ACH5RR_012551 [Cinchona calisaya]|uniref:Reverse transcriptase RNase H-like domain-containing protein n=1 Tax=Cinchona calisaya TaxID=153742 RepID=A0ABD3ABP0_9GENT
MGYDYEVNHKNGVENLGADALSRRPSEDAQICAISMIKSQLLFEIQQSWQTDPKLQELIHKLLLSDQSHPSHYTWQNNQLRRKDRFVVGNNFDLWTKIIGLCITVLKLRTCLTFMGYQRWNDKVKWLSKHWGADSFANQLKLVPFVATIYHIWKGRNGVIFQKKEINKVKVFADIRTVACGYAHFGGLFEGIRTGN